MTTDTGHFDLQRSFATTSDKLWHLLTDAKMREAWAAPEEGMLLQAKSSDFRVGGRELHICGPEDSPEFEIDTAWYRIDAPTDAVFTETIRMGPDTLATSLVTCRIMDTDSGAELSVNVAVSSFGDPDATAEVEAGWNAGLANLAALAEKSG